MASDLGHPEMPEGADFSGPLHEQAIAQPEALILSAIQTVDAIR
jgi:hypothetical protein